MSSDAIVNVGARLSEMARGRPDQLAVVAPLGRDRTGRRQYARMTFRELDEDSDAIAAGLRQYGARPGMRLVLLVKPSVDFISLVFGLFKSGVVTVLIDPGMGRGNLIRCLSECEPDGFVAIPMAQAIRTVLRHRFPKAKLNVTVGRRWFWGGTTLERLRRDGREAARSARGGDSRLVAATRAEDPAAIIFTTGSTGPPKGVLYRHGNFSRQVDEIRDFYGIQPGEIDLPGFPLFALFNAAMGVTTIIPDMDFTRPAQADPRLILEAARDWRVTQAFGSPALWNRVASHCVERGERIETLRRVLSAGAPVPPHVLKKVLATIAPGGDMHTPYGATESLPVASIAASEVLRETAARTGEGAGTCVGRRHAHSLWGDRVAAGGV
ncbi:MAG TPA: AMP-binding protein, partial [Pirellulaceae bacterium]|nr:AMP-binding protein [Pirellulaceae bacterium]